MKLSEAEVGQWVQLLDSKNMEIVWVKEFSDLDEHVKCSDLKGHITRYNGNCEIRVVENYTADGMS